MKSDRNFKLSKYLKKYSGWISFYIFVFVLVTVVDVFIPILTANAVEDITFNEYRSAIYNLLFVIGLSIASYFLSGLLNFLYNRYGMRMIGDISLDCVAQSFKISSQSYSNHSSGQFMDRIVNDPNRIVGELSSMVNMISNIVTTLIIIIYVFILNYIIGLCVVALLIVSLIITSVRLKKFNKNMQSSDKARENLVSIVNETIKSEKDIKTTGLEQKLKDTVNDRTNNTIKENYKLYNTNQTLRLFNNALLEVLLLGVLILGIVLMEKGLVTIAIFMVIYSYRGSIKSFSNFIGFFFESIATIKNSLGRIRELFEDKEYELEKFGNVHLDKVQGEIEFKDVIFKYKEYEYKKDKKTKVTTKTLKNETQVLDKINFKIQPNTTVAFVGKSGSGKSTILSLISKMLEADDGQVLIDGVDIKDLDKDTLRKSISLVNQFPYIFDMSIKENLLLAKENATDEEIEKAIKDSYLKEFIDTLPNGIDTVVGESGIKLSGGQRQRLAIARALLRQTSIIIFDESTSSLDNFAQEHIKKCIDNLKGKSTIVIVAHRLSTIKNVDDIFFLEEGKIVDEGSFDKLFKKNKEFKNMFTMENLQDELKEQENA